MVIRLIHEGTIHGFLAVSAEQSRGVFDVEEQSLFVEVASDLAFALNGIALEKKAQLKKDQLRESEGRYRRLFEAAKDGILILDAETGMVDDVNPFLIKLLGFAKETFLGKAIWELGLFKDVFANQEKFSELQKQEYVRYDDLPLETSDGRRIEVEFVSNVYLVNQRKVIQCNIRDISERKRAEKSLLREKQYWEDTFDSITDMITVHDREYNIVRSNKAAQKQLGLSSLATPGEKCFRHYHGTDRPPEGCPSCACLQTGESATFEVFEHHLNKHLEIRAIPRLDDDGQLVGLIHIVRDITERKQAERELQESKELITAVVENVPLMIFLKEAQDLRFVVFNRAGEDLLGYDRKDLLGKNNLDLFPPEQAAFFMAKDREVLAADVLLDIPEEPILTAKKGQRLLHTRKLCIKGADGVTKYLLGISDDITDRKRMEQERAELEMKLLRQQRLESIGILAAGVAHEINNPLNGVINFAQLILDNADPASKPHEYAGVIIKEGERVAKIVKSLLTFARHGKEGHSPARMTDIIESTLMLIGAVLRKDNIQYTVELPPDLPQINCRSQQIQQVLMNLLTNARDALNERYPGHDPDKQVLITVRPFEREGEQWIRTTVEDHGTGVPPELMARIFDPFFTTKPKERGTGLGLSISYGIVKEHHGELRVESERNRFTRFHVELRVNNSGQLEPKSLEGEQP